MTPRFLCVAALLFFSHSAMCENFVYPVGVKNARPTVDLPNPNGYKITTGFREDGHTGVDLANGSEGDVVRAIGPGTVSYRCLGECYGFGNVVSVRHDVPGGPFYSVYAHLKDNSVLVSETDLISVAGQPIAQVGNTGKSTGPHLHFAIKSKNPKDQLGCGYIAPGQCNSEVGQEAIYQDPLDFIERLGDGPIITFVARGKVYDFGGDNGVLTRQFPKAFGPGVDFVTEYTFRQFTPDLNPAQPSYGTYLIDSAKMTVGQNAPVLFPKKIVNHIIVESKRAGAAYDSYALNIQNALSFIDGVEPTRFGQLNMVTRNGNVFQSDALPSIPPDITRFPVLTDSSGVKYQWLYVCPNGSPPGPCGHVYGTITSLTRK